jgi:hypothetical protein
METRVWLEQGGDRRPLTPSEPGVRWEPLAWTPDGTRLFVRGHAVRLYAAEGRLLREIPVPDGLDVPAAAWSPDSRAFVYVVGSRGFFTL